MCFFLFKSKPLTSFSKTLTLPPAPCCYLGADCRSSPPSALPHSSVKLHGDRPAGSGVWTQHFSRVSFWGQAQGLLFSSRLLHYWIRGLPHTRSWTQPRGNMQIWWINIAVEQRGREARSKGTLGRIDQIEAGHWRSLCFNCLSFSCTPIYVDIYL